MSEFTYGTVVRSEHIDKIRKHAPKGLAAILPLSEQWVGVFTSEDGEMGGPEEFLSALSSECPALYFYNLEDHHWGYTLWNEGDMISSAHVSYEMPEELIIKIAEERYPDQDSTFFYFTDEGEAIFQQIRDELAEGDHYAEALRKHFETVYPEDFKLFGFDDETVEALRGLLTAESFLRGDADVDTFKSLTGLEQFSWMRYERMERYEEQVEYI
ncbi:hypothetical protein [Paenibacillus mucilaginosus]|uniref:Uncharacterized protein n=1 Tax=Paenibacillus mucilaginosus (strain KNP414) TaxID=1036673 RepID=F8FKK8_PAEMK|nr:hypothetical protein [Paenibacillus mucilaginosus]AEI45601.1 hypothetical protein KNP414_07091 [Paenibacillus mucilaginosus KNP414]MCG7215347.1 hypothetical protein [Paenibacillus mucilaginosus]WDM27007.1 hypothetical protein KCX80_32175 [Paenibacillus mucilaginosus]